LNAVDFEEMGKLIVPIRVEASTGIVVPKRHIWPWVRSVKKWLATGALVGVVVVAIDCFTKGFGDINSLASRVDLT
jgi:hypothetical protein